MFLDISVRFPHLGIEIENLSKTISIFGFEIAYYGIIIAFGMFAGYFLTQWQAKRTEQSSELYLDLSMYVIVAAIIGARIYYVIFSWDVYKDDLKQILNIRGGGLAIYGGIIAAVITCFVYSRIKKVSFWIMLDTACAGLAIGQAIGRWGNFFNREAFGRYTNSFLAMQIKRTEVSSSAIAKDTKYLENLVSIDGIEYIQVHPTFLYESILCLCLCVILLVYTKHKKFNGELMFIYLAVYGAGRAIIEGLRTDQLLLWNTDIAVSQLLSIVIVVASITVVVYKRVRIRKLKVKKC